MPISSDIATGKNIEPTREFAAPHPSEIGRLIKGSAKWSLILFVCRQGVAFISTAVLARLVTPSDYGLVAMATLFTAFLGLVDVGLGWSTVQAKELNDRMVNSLFWLGAMWGVFLWGICTVSGCLLASFYGQPELTGICFWLGVGLLLNSLVTQPVALLKRRMRQQSLAAVETTSLLVANSVAIILAIYGWGYWALVSQVLLVGVVRIIIVMTYSDFHISMPYIHKSNFSLLKFGAYMGGCSWITYFQLYLDSILVGRFCGPVDLGYYSRAFYLKTLPSMYSVQSMNDVLIPALAALQQDSKRLGKMYRKALKVISFWACPSAVLLGVAAPEIVHLLYGPAWHSVVPLLQWFSISAAIMPIYNTGAWLFIATGKSREFLRLSLVLTPIAVVAYGIAISGGPLSMAQTSAVLFSIPLPLATIYYAHRITGLELIETVKSILPILVACLVACIATTVAGYSVGMMIDSPLVLLATKIGVCGLVYFGAAKILIGQIPVERKLL